MTNFYVRKNNLNSNFYLKKTNNNFYIRNGEPSVSPPLSLVDTGLIFYADAGNPSSYSAPSTSWNDLISPQTNLTLGRSDMYVSDGGGSLYVQGSYADIQDLNYGDYSDYSDNYLNFGTDSFSIELWTMNTGGQQGYEYQAILNIGTYTNGILLRYIKNISYGLDSLYIAGSYYDWDPQFKMLEDTWVHMVIVKSSTNVKLYVNTVQIINATAPSIVSPSAGILIGKSAHAIQEEYYGYMSTLRIYRNYALTSADVTQNFNATKNRYGL